MEERKQPILLGGGQERPELGDGPHGAWFLSLRTWPLGPFHRVAANQLVHDDGIAKRLPEHRVQMGHGGDGERLAVTASAGQQAAVELGDGGRPYGLDRQVADAWRRVEPDAGPVVGQGARLDLHRVSFDPVVQVRRHGDPVPVDVLAVPGLHPGLVPGGLGVLLGGEAAHPSGLLMPVSGSLTRIT